MLHVAKADIGSVGPLIESFALSEFFLAELDQWYILIVCTGKKTSDIENAMISALK